MMLINAVRVKRAWLSDGSCVLVIVHFRRRVFSSIAKRRWNKQIRIPPNHPPSPCPRRNGRARFQVSASLTRHVKIAGWTMNETDGLQTSRSRLEMLARTAYFPGGRMTVRCESNQFQLYKKYSVIELTDDSPRLALMVSPTAVTHPGGESNIRRRCSVIFVSATHRSRPVRVHSSRVETYPGEFGGVVKASWWFCGVEKCLKNDNKK